MADGKLDHDWNLTSHLLAASMNTFADKANRVTPNEINPRIARKEKKVKIPFSQFKEYMTAMFVKETPIVRGEPTHGRR